MPLWSNGKIYRARGISRSIYIFYTNLYQTAMIAKYCQRSHTDTFGHVKTITLYRRDSITRSFQPSKCRSRTDDGASSCCVFNCGEWKAIATISFCYSVRPRTTRSDCGTPYYLCISVTLYLFSFNGVSINRDNAKSIVPALE